MGWDPAEEYRYVGCKNLLLDISEVDEGTAVSSQGEMCCHWKDWLQKLEVFPLPCSAACSEALLSAQGRPLTALLGSFLPTPCSPCLLHTEGKSVCSSSLSAFRVPVSVSAVPSLGSGRDLPGHMAVSQFWGPGIVTVLLAWMPVGCVV